MTWNKMSNENSAWKDEACRSGAACSRCSRGCMCEVDCWGRHKMSVLGVRSQKLPQAQLLLLCSCVNTTTTIFVHIHACAKLASVWKLLSSTVAGAFHKVTAAFEKATAEEESRWRFFASRHHCTVCCFIFASTLFSCRLSDRLTFQVLK